MRAESQPLIFDFGDLKLHELAKLWFFKLIMTYSNFKKSVMTSFQSRHHHYVTKNVTKLTSQDFFHVSPLIPIKIIG